MYIVRNVQFIKSDTNQIFPWKSLLLGKQNNDQLLIKFLILYATQNFITVFTKSCKQILYWARYMLFTPSYYLYFISLLMLSSESSKWSLPFNVCTTRALICLDFMTVIFVIFGDEHNYKAPQYVMVSYYLAHFPCFDKIKAGLWDHLAVCVSLCPPSIFECLNQSLWNLVRISWHLSPSQRCTS
jgi:hypothetical protein